MNTLFIKELVFRDAPSTMRLAVEIFLGGVIMALDYYYKDDQWLLNFCAKHLARFNTEARHNFNAGVIPDRECDRICEAWRFPIVDTYGGGADSVTDPDDFDAWNEVSFIWVANSVNDPQRVGIIGTFRNLYEPVPLRRVMFLGQPTRYWSVTFVVPKEEAHRYRFFVDEEFRDDPINPLRMTLENGATWPLLFTEGCPHLLVLEDWECGLLRRLVEQILPFRTRDADTFLRQFYNSLDRASKDVRQPHAYRLDESVGEVDFLDNILAREERHHLVDYKICLKQVNLILRQRNPFLEPTQMSREMYVDLYNDMASNNVPGWDYNAYGSPQYFLDLLRRHAVTGAFSHPKYGGNGMGAGWAYLADRYESSPGKTLFNWRAALERPLRGRLRVQRITSKPLARVGWSEWMTL